MLEFEGLTSLDTALTWWPSVQSWHGGELLSADVPVDSGSVTWSTSREVPGTLDLTVPRERRGVSWVPGSDPSHPLARFGQVLHVSVRFASLVSNLTWERRLGTFLITGWDLDAGTVRVTGESQTRRLVGARFRTPTAPRSGGTLASEAKRLASPHMGVIIDPALVNRAVPAMSWGESRVEALQEIADAWPARMREDAWGNLTFSPPLPATAVPTVTLTDRVGGTVVGAYQSDTRDGTYNVVVARGQEADDAGKPAFQAIADVSYGPLKVSDYFEEVRFFSSPLITSREIAQSSAETMLANSVRPARTIPVTVSSDPRWELDDAVAIEADDGRFWGYVGGFQMPLTVDDGDMRMDVHVA